MMNPRLKLTLKVIASLCIAIHLFAIFVAPASVAPTSPLIHSTWSKFSPYLYATNLNHGYHFFAPEPGSSTLLEFKGSTNDGQIVHGVLPDKQQIRPRLLYHRYFMLTEYLGSFPPEAPERQQVINNFANQLLQNKGLNQVELTLVRHRPSTRQEILIGEDLNSAETFEREPLGTFSWNAIQSSLTSSSQ